MKKTKNYIITAIGIVLFITGLCLVKTIDDLPANVMALPYVCIGVGCGVFGHGMGNIIADKAIRKNPDVQKQIEIAKNDERNITIAKSAKAKAFDLMTTVFGALMIAFALMGVDVMTVLLLVFAYLFVHGYAVYYQCKYNKDM